MSALHYIRGEWVEKADPVYDGHDDETDVDKLIRHAGYELWSVLSSNGDAVSIPLSISVYSRTGHYLPADERRRVANEPPRFMITVEASTIEHAYANDLPDLMAVLAVWAPAAEAAAMTALLDDVADLGETRPGTIAALLASFSSLRSTKTR